jgi:hypothetical protein
VPAAGSPKTAREVKPRYPRQTPHQPWRPATKPPNRKAEGLRRLLREFQRQDEIVKAMMTPSPDLMRAWLHRPA